MRSSFHINGTKIDLGPTDIQQLLPQSGKFEPSRGPAVIFPTQYTNNNRVTNLLETWVWNLVIESEATYDILIAQAYKGASVLLTTEYGEDMGTPITYSGKILDIVPEHKDGMTFKNNKRGYRFTMIVNTWS